MYIETTEDVEEAIENNRFDVLIDSLDSDLMCQLMLDDRYDLVEKVYSKFNQDIDVEQSIFLGALKCSSQEPSDIPVKCIQDFIVKNKKMYSYEDESDILFYMSQFDENLKLIKLLVEIETDIPWDNILRTSCAYLLSDTVIFLVNKINFSINNIERAFGMLINSPINDYGYDNPEQKKLILYFLNDLNISVNTKLDSQWGWAYLDCFRNAPNSAKYFYTEEFDSLILNSTEFWKNFLHSVESSEEFKSCFSLACRDLKLSGIDLTDQLKILEDLGYKKLAQELFR